MGEGIEKTGVSQENREGWLTWFRPFFMGFD